VAVKNPCSDGCNLVLNHAGVPQCDQCGRIGTMRQWREGDGDGGPVETRTRETVERAKRGTVH
jgi:hypothetical protein